MAWTSTTNTEAVNILFNMLALLLADRRATCGPAVNHGHVKLQFLNELTAANSTLPHRYG
jgi:hypothetical protein